MRNRTAIFTVFYPGVEPYISEFLQSLVEQTDKKFTLFLVNDGLHNIGRFFEGLDLSVKVLDKTAQPAALRKAGINWVVSEGVDNIIFADSDDYFAHNRVAISKKLLLDHDLVFNELLLVGDKISQPIPMFGKLFADGEQISAYSILVGNCIGLSNSAIRSDKISTLMTNIPDNIIAFDWTFFVLCLHDGATAVFTNKTETYYRQYDGNIASPCSYSNEQIMRGVQVKSDHYSCASKYDNKYVRLSIDFKNLYSKLYSDTQFQTNYCQSVRMNSSTAVLWWESIKTVEELNL